MPLSKKGHGLKLVDNGNGKLTVEFDSTGNPAFDDSDQETVFSLLMELPWFGDRKGKRRSKLPSVKSRDSSTKGKLEQYAKDALQPAIDDGRLLEVGAVAETNGAGYLLKVTYTNRSGKQSSIDVPLSV